MQQIVILGATGSIGSSTLDVIARHPDRYRAHTLVANQSVESMAELCRQHRPTQAIMGNELAAHQLRVMLDGQVDTDIVWGETAMVNACRRDDVDSVMAAIVGFAGLRPALAAAETGKRLMLANKEALVSAGRVFVDAVKRGGATLLPIDSEHNAMFQCVTTDAQARPQMQGVEKILLTASGGPFRGWCRDQLHEVTPAQAVAHPNWSMGQKISVDSATLMNKGLEFAEACWLFNVSPKSIQVVVHPQSIIHSLIQYVDGSVLAQMGQPDMRTPIAYALAWPERVAAGVASLDLFEVARLDFVAPDLDAFPCLRLAQEAVVVPGAMCALNAANEIAVAAFLAGDIRFTDIDRLIEHTLTKAALAEPMDLDAVEALDAQARDISRAWLAGNL